MGGSFKIKFFHGAVKDFDIQSFASMDLCFLHFISIHPIILFLSSVWAVHSSTALVRGLWRSKTLQLNYGRDIQPTSGHKRHTVAAGEAARVRQGEDWEGKKINSEGDAEERTERQESPFASSQACSRHSRTVWPHRQTGRRRGRELGNVEGMWMKECIYRFCPGTARDIDGIFLFCRAHAPPRTRPSQ